MQLYFMRHGPAVEPAAWRGEEAERPLTDQGRARIRETARGLAALGLRFDLVATSPYARAVESAALVARITGTAGEVEECPALAPGVRLDPLLGFLERFSAGERTLLVGHAPDMGRLVLALIGSRQSHGLAVRKGGVGCVEIDAMPPQQPGRLLWLAPPGLLRALAGAPAR